MSKRLFRFLPFLGLAVIIPRLIFMENSNKAVDGFVKIEKEALHLAGAASPKVIKKNAGLNWSQKKQRVKGVLPKGSPGKFAEWHSGIRTREGAASPDYPANYKVKELLKAKGLKSTRDLSLNSRSQTLNWQERGPGNVAGRTRSILIDQNDPNYDTWIVGSVGGGIWKTTNAGEAWTELTKDLPNLATSAIAWAPNFPNTIYAGTGEGFFNVDQIDGTGIWKTDDGGSTWSQIASVADNREFENIMRMAVDPADPMVLVVAVARGFNHFPGTGPNSGIYRTADGGTTWTKTYDAGANFLEDLRANPKNFNTQFATINGAAVIKSIDGGQTWFQSDQGINFTGTNAVSGRMELTIAESDTDRIYISAQGGNAGSILYSSSDAGATWFPHVNAAGNDFHWLAGQGWYDNSIGANPYNADEVFVGGVNLWKLEASTSIDTSAPKILWIDTEETQSFWTFVNWGGAYAGGGLDLGSVFWGTTPLEPSENTSVEIRFGPGKKQKAHRFVFVREGETSTYIYRDYVDVNFEVWDITNNRQLMISFRDDEDNGFFELEDRATDTGGQDREYLMIHTLTYDIMVDTNIARDDGMIYRNIYTMWPEAPSGVGETDFSDVTEDAVIRINWGSLLTRGVETTNITDWRGQFGGSSKGVHVDHHVIVFVKTDENTQSFRFLNGNDGGISYSDDGGETFKQTGDELKGYNTSQFYGVDKMNGADRYIGGTQDNGAWLSPENPDATSSWQHAPSGDGFEAVWNYRDPDLMLESSQYNSIYRSTNRGRTWTYIGGLIQAGSATSPFFTKIAKSKQDADLVFAIGSAGVWRSENFGASWTLTKMPGGFVGDSSFAQIVISLANPQIVWTAMNMKETSPPFVSTDGGLTFDSTNVYTDVTLGRISGLDTHPTEENTAYILQSYQGAPKVLRTTDLGQTWEDISGFGANSISAIGFPDVAVYSLLVMPYNNDIIWVGTEIGIFESTDGGGNWAFADNGLSAVSVYEMLIVNDEVVIATHGRGIWSVALPQLAGYEPPVVPFPPRLLSLKGGGGGVISANVYLPSAYDSSFVVVDGVKTVSLPANSVSIDTTFDFVVNTGGLDTLNVSLSAYANRRNYTSLPDKIVVFPVSSPLSSYAENFDEGGEEFFVFSNIGVALPPGFMSPAIHTSHPYPDATNMIALLIAPIIVAATDATLKYDDIAIVEPGNGSGVFGNSQFFDYVVVEGSKDNGSTWAPLADGYDARADAAWLASYPAGPGAPSMFVSHEINLLDTFAADDVILVRFRLFADANSNGWGWAVDNINIQDGVVSVESDDILPSVFSLSQNYPNPFNPTTQINYDLPKDSEVTLQIFNVAGQKVRDLVVGQAQKAGRYTTAWNGRDNHGIQVSSGLYFYRIKAGHFVKTQKMTLLK